MHDYDKSEAGSRDEPLFVLKYLGYKRIIPISGLIICLFFFGLATFVVPSIPFSSRLIGFFCFSLFLIRLTDLVLFKEIRLYKKQMVKVWTFIGAREIELAKARLRSFSSPTLGIKGKSLSKQDMNVHWGWIFSVFLLSGISYLEHLADPREVKKLNGLLAEVCGRSTADFEQTATFDTMIKKEDM
jgi:hypothetical protein